MVKLYQPMRVLALFAIMTAAEAHAAEETAENNAPSAPTHRLPSDESFDGLNTQNLPAKPRTSAALESGLSSPFSVSARVVPGGSWARAVGGYDGAAQAFRLRSSAETVVADFLAFRVDFEHGLSTSTTDRVSLGLRLQLLRQEAHGIDLGVGLFYNPNDFRKEGNAVGALMLGRRFEQGALLASALVGSDPEGDDQEIDGRLATLFVVLPDLQLGLNSRFRSVLSTDAKGKGMTTVDWELAVLSSAAWTLGPIVLIGEAGLSSLHITELSGQPNQRKNLRTGILVMSGLGYAF
jgi:hypothetical protein